MSKKVGFLELVRSDLARYGAGTGLRGFMRQYLLSPGFKYLFWFRMTASLREAGFVLRPLHFVGRFMLSRYKIRYGISIPYNVSVGRGLYIGHFGGIVVSHKAVIGENCNISHDVTVGEKFGGKNPGVPQIGDRVYLGPGCKVFGSVVIGNDSAVGANAVVVDSIPESGVAVGNPARVVSRNGSAEYVTNLN